MISPVWGKASVSERLSQARRAFLRLIPRQLASEQKRSVSDFTRNRELPFAKVVVFVLFLTCSGKRKGVDTKSGEFFKAARRSGLWPDARAVHRSAVTKARQKVDWRIFQELCHQAVAVAYSVLPQREEDRWHGMNVYAIDGSKYTLPGTDELRARFDPNSGLAHEGKGHYPQCLVSTVYDVFRRIPLARTVVEVDGSEREEVKALLPFVPEGGVWMFDRGYPSYELLLLLSRHYAGYFLFRCSASESFPAVSAFAQSGKKEAIIHITPSKKYKSAVDAETRKGLPTLTLRAIRMVNPGGEVSILVTNLVDPKAFPRQDIIELYRKRWEIEGYYRDEKVTLEIETFHSRTVNGVLQEFYAVMMMSIITRTLMALTVDMLGSPQQESQFKNAIMTLAAEAAVLLPDHPDRAIVIFNEIIIEIARVKYYRPKTPRPSQPRYTKKTPNKWCRKRPKAA